MDYILRNSYLSNKLPRPLPPPGPERASNLAWMGLQNNLQISPTIVSNGTEHFNGCGSPSRENKQKYSKMTVSNPRVWNTARSTLLTSSFSQDQFHKIVFISTSLHVNRPESGSNFTNPKKVARGQEPEGEEADRVPGGSQGQPWIGWPGRRKALCCSSGPAGPRAGIGSPGLPTGREAIPAHSGSALLPHAPKTQDLTLKALEIPTSARTGSHGCPGTGLDVPVFSGLTALPAPNSPRLHGRLWEPAFPIYSLPHVIRIPPGELANILIHIL